jgi:hypothetical protein
MDQARKLIPSVTDDMVDESFVGVMSQVCVCACVRYVVLSRCARCVSVCVVGGGGRRGCVCKVRTRLTPSIHHLPTTLPFDLLPCEWTISRERQGRCAVSQISSLIRFLSPIGHRSWRAMELLRRTLSTSATCWVVRHSTSVQLQHRRAPPRLLSLKRLSIRLLLTLGGVKAARKRLHSPRSGRPSRVRTVLQLERTVSYRLASRD